MKVDPLKLSDFEEIEPQPAQIYWRAHRTPEEERFLANEIAFTARDNGRIVACAGVVSLGQEAGICWALIARDAGRHFLRFRGMFERMIETSGKRRLFANTECDFADGCRWLEILGFARIEQREPFCGPDGREHHLYERTF